MKKSPNESPTMVLPPKAAPIEPELPAWEPGTSVPESVPFLPPVVIPNGPLWLTLVVAMVGVFIRMRYTRTRNISKNSDQQQ